MVSIEGHARTTLAHVREVTAQIRANLKRTSLATQVWSGLDSV